MCYNGQNPAAGIPRAGNLKEPLINSPARLAASLLRSAARENLDLAFGPGLPPGLR